MSDMPTAQTPTPFALTDADTPDRTATTRHARIAELAYRRSQARDFAPGAELDDWLSAEGEVDGSAVDA